jgi:DUF1365 family protein
MLMLDLDELDSVFSGRLLWSVKSPALARFRSQDHLIEFADVKNLRDRAISALHAKGFSKKIGAVRLLTQLRYLGYAMNPVSFFYCFDPTNTHVEAVIAEVNNTPWGEQHLYVIPAVKNRIHSRIAADEIDKTFHVSPFMSMDMSYRMAFSNPGQKLGVKIENHASEAAEGGCEDSPSNKKLLDVTMLLNRKPITTRNLNWMLIKYPLLSFKVFAGIYWQALRLYLKKVPFHSHPGKLKLTEIEGEAACTIDRDLKNPVDSDSETVLVGR